MVQTSDLRLPAFREGGQFAPGRPIRSVPEQIVGLHDLVNLARAFVNDRALAVPEETADRVLVRIAVRAVNLHRVSRGALGRDGREPFREAGLARVALAVVLHPPRSQPEEAR